MTKKIGILGGTFDPVHNGHLAIAQYAHDICGLSKVLLVPTGIPPHKTSACITAPIHRYNMAKLAACDVPYIEISDVEVFREGYSYTIDTIRIFRKQMPDAELFYIIGADNLTLMMEWKDSEELLRELNIICLSREGYDMHGTAGRMRENYDTQITMLEIPNILVSSTSIRTALKSQKNVDEYLPHSVYQYILTNKLYHGGN